MIYGASWEFNDTKPYENFIFKKVPLQNTIVWSILYGFPVGEDVKNAIAYKKKIQLHDNHQYSDK